MPSSSELIEVGDLWGAHNYSPVPVVIHKAEGAWVTDVEGKRYLDMLSAYSAMSFGHCHPELVAAAKEQLETCTLTSRAFHNDQLPVFCRSLAQLCGLDKVLPMNSGAEAVETAIKAARRWGYEVKGVPADKARILTFHNNFHGRTTTIVGFSTSSDSSEGFGPFTPGFDTAPFGDIEAARRRAVHGETVGVLIEPIQGEGGIVVPPEGYMAQMRELCDEYGMLLISDEIQTGLGRTGKMFDTQHDGVKPDIYILGKALGGGILPISAIVGTKEVMDVFTPGSHGSTFGGNPLACAVALKAIEILERGDLIEASATNGAWFMEKLAAIKNPLIHEVRGRGLLIGLELLKVPAKALSKKLYARGILCKDTRESVIRFAPPLMISREDLEHALTEIEASLAELASEAG